MFNNKNFNKVHGSYNIKIMEMSINFGDFKRWKQINIEYQPVLTNN